MHWAAFLVVGAVTRLPALPSHTPSQPQVSGGAGESDSTPLVEADSYGCPFLEAVTEQEWIKAKTLGQPSHSV